MFVCLFVSLILQQNNMWLWSDRSDRPECGPNVASSQLTWYNHSTVCNSASHEENNNKPTQTGTVEFISPFQNFSEQYLEQNLVKVWYILKWE